MRSLTLDNTSFTPSLLTILSSLPNSISNSIWEATPNSDYIKPAHQSSYEERRTYITAKYANKQFVEELPTSPIQFLIEAIENRDLKGMLWALANNADPNATGNIPALLMALLKDDKMANGSSNDFCQPSFPLAELLVLNGATPIDPRSLPVEADCLSESAKTFLQEKVDRIAQTGHVSSSIQVNSKSLTNSTSSS
jgi:Arf-GAP with SH3 domain, ANK repeat and PH domain-containing protein